MKNTLIALRKSMPWFALLLLVLVPFQFSQAEESDGTWDDATATHITLDDAGISIEGEGASAEGGIITISKSGTYVLTGTLTDGQVRIAATKKDSVRLVLDGVQLSSTTGAPIYASQADALILVLAEGTHNVVTDAAEYVLAAGTDEPDAAIFSKDGLTICGNGSLTVTGNYRNGIGTKDDLVIQGGTLSITAANDGLRGRDSVLIVGGSITINAGNDGIKSNHDTDAAKGWIVINGGSLDITAAYDGIQAETSLVVNGGDIRIVAGGGAQNAATPAQNDQRWPNRGETLATDSTGSESYKGLKANTTLQINGGTILVDAADDAVQANGDVTLSGGTMTLTSGDDGVHADGALIISGGTILIPSSYEGLEGATVTITGGDIHLTASDDGINAAGGNDGESGGGFGRDDFRMGGSSDYWIAIDGGSIWISAQGDGIDSNGALTIGGGDIVVHGPTSGGNGALDAGGSILISGGKMITAGSSGMAQGPDSSSSQASLAIYYTQPQPAGTVVSLLDASGAVLATYTAEKNFETVMFSVPALTIGQTYTATTSGGLVTEVVLASVQVAVSDTGAAIEMGGMGGFGGGPNGRGGGRGGMRTMPDGMIPPAEGQGMEGAPPPEQEQQPSGSL